MKKYSFAFLFLIIINLITFTLPAVAQTGMRLNIIPDGLGFSNQLEYSYNVDLEREVLENWLNMDYIKGVFSAGLRFDIFQPNDPDPSISRGKEKQAKIDFIYFGAGIGNMKESLDLVVGNYYALVGRGMIIKSYEDRNIRIDNNLLGLKVVGRYKGFIITALSGMPENSQAERKDILHLADLEYRYIKWLKIGGTYASNLPPVDGLARTDMAALRLIPSFWNIDMYAEYGIKMNSDIEKSKFNNSESLIGKGFYGNLNFYLGPISLLGEYKYYDNFSFTTNDGTVNYNTPPSVRLEYAYMLPNRHPSPLDVNNEEGYQMAAGYSIDSETYLNAAYTMTKSLSADSYFQRINDFNVSVSTQLKEFYFQAQHDWSSSLTTIAAFSYNEELATNTKNITPIIEAKYYFENINTIKAVFEHQHSTNKTTDEQHYTDVLSLEYLRSPNFSVALVAELETKEPETGHIVRKFFGFIQAGYKIGNHTDLSILAGTRQAGNICIGGVCRFEPEFRGVEVKVLTSL
jgi:hypothetical protein